jgi:hypothetical protein
LYVYSNTRAFSGEYPNQRSERVPLRVRWIGTPGTVEQSEVSRDVTKISYRGEAGSQLVLGASYETARYKLADTWRAPSLTPTAQGFEHDDSGGGCPSWNVLRVTLDQPTAAIRIRWTFADVTFEWVLPAEGELILIGERSCGGTTVPTEQLAIGGRLELIAIRLDGSEIAVRGVPSTISFNDAAKIDSRAEIKAALLELRRAETPRELPDVVDERVIASLVLLGASLVIAGWWLRKALARLR